MIVMANNNKTRLAAFASIILDPSEHASALAPGALKSIIPVCTLGTFGASN